MSLVYPCDAAGSVNIGATWTPADLGSALRLWIKADTGITSSGGLISQANDQSGNGFNLLSSGTTRPTLNATGYNSKPTIAFTPGSKTNLCTTVIGLGQSPKSFAMGSTSSWFFIGQMASGTDTFGRALSYIGGTAGGGAVNDYNGSGCVAAIVRNSTTNALCMYQAALTTGASASVSLSTNMRVLMVFDGTNVTQYINNVAVGGPAACAFTLDSTGTITLGGDMFTTGGVAQPPASCWDGNMAEVLVTNTALDATTRGKLDTYVVARLGA